MSPTEAEYDGGFDVDRNVLGWVLIGVGAAAMIAGIVFCAKGARSYIAAKKAVENEIPYPENHSMSSAIGERPCRCSGRMSIIGGIASFISGAGCALGGSILSDCSEYIGIHISGSRGCL